MRSSFLRIALTGGIGTGKSYCLERFARLGVPVIDADAIAREVLQPGAQELSAVADRFGAGIVDAAGALDRAALARIVFADPAARRDLEAIVHPVVYGRIDAWFVTLGRQFDRSGSPAFAIADIPLLYETGRDADFDRVIVAACSSEQQVDRLVARGWNREQAMARMAAQLPIDEKRRRATDVIDTSGTLAETDEQVRELWRQWR